MPLPENIINKMIKQTIDGSRTMAARLDESIKEESDTGTYTLEGGTIAAIAALLEVNATLLAGLHEENQLIVSKMLTFEKKLNGHL